MTDDFDDQITRRLASLRADLADTTLAGADAARRRAAQRTRHQITGGVIAGVAVVAVGVVGIVQPDFRAERPQPAQTPTTNPTSVPDEALLTPADVQGSTDVEWQRTDQPGESFDCTPIAPDGATRAHFVTGDAQLDQFVESSSDARQRFADVRAQVEACIDGLSQQDDRYGMFEAWDVGGIGDEAWMAAYSAPLLVPDEFAETSIVQVRLVRSGEHVMVVAEGGPGQDFNEAMAVDRAINAATRLCEAVAEPCVGQPDPVRVYPPDVGDLTGWLPSTDIAAATGLPATIEGTEPLPSDGWGFVGLPPDPAAAGARAVDVRTYTVPREDPGLAVTQTVARFDDAATASSHYAELVVAADSFTQDGDVIENTGGVSSNGYEGMTWRSENADIGLVFVYGVVLVDDAIATVSHGISDDENRDVTGEQMIQLMTAAAERLL